MAQRKRALKLARRFGMGDRAPMRAAVLVCAAVALGGLLFRLPSGGVVVERGAEAELVRGADGEGSSAPDEGAGVTEGDAAGGSAAGGDVGAGGGDSGEGTEEAPASLVVHVDGAVLSPGIVRLEGANLRVADAVEAAGGLADGADTTALNLAARIEDGQKVHVPAEGEQPVVAEQPAAAGVTRDLAAPSSDGLINLNTADAALLQELPGIGERTAEAIIQDREQNGAFTCKEDLMRVSGIGEKKFAKLESLVTV